jgi:hypothetical protein
MRGCGGTAGRDIAAPISSADAPPPGGATAS